MNQKKIKFITGNSSLELNNYYLSLTPENKGIFNNFQFFFNTDIEDYDYVVFFEHFSKEVKVSVCLDKVIFIAGEATSIKKYKQNFLDQFGHIITCQEDIKHKSKFLQSPGHSWFSKKSYDELINIDNIKKTKLLSIVVSNKAFTKGHKDRLDFCLKLKERLGDQVDLFGRGFNEFDDKWEVIAPYKYSIAIENSVENHWVTEKIGDCYTSHTFPFYMGAPNIEDYYNPDSYALIDVLDFEKSVAIITNIINDSNHYNNHLEFLKESKRFYLNKHSIIPMVCSFIDKKLSEAEDESENKELIIFPEKLNFHQNNKLLKFLHKLYKKILLLP
tara:strand:+ start:1895 stop:2887 length:993 start_codon:yes stop_codon:yes gene_type:complete